MDRGQEASRSACNVEEQKVCNVMFLCSEWKSSKGGLPTFNREFAVNLAKSSNGSIKVHCYVCQSDELDREDARQQGVNLITAPTQSVPGSSDPLDCLKIPPPELPHPDIVIGHGRKFGTPAFFIVQAAKCKWMHFVHVFCEDLGKYKLAESGAEDAIESNEKKHKSEIELCKAADVVIAVGSRLQDKYSRSLPGLKVEIITPGILEKFSSESTQLAQAKKFNVFMFGRAAFEDLTLKGYDIVANAIGSLGKKFELTFVGSLSGEHRKIEQWFLENTCIRRNQVTIRSYCNQQDELKMMFRESDLVALPSRTEGFGLVALEAISAGIPVLVTDESGIAEALEQVESGKSVIVESNNADEWAQRIQHLSRQSPGERQSNVMRLRENYRRMYSWSTECEKFKRMIQDLMQWPQITCSINEPKHTEQGPSVGEINVEESTNTRRKRKAPSSSSVSQDSVKKAKSEPIQQTSEPVPDPAIHLTESNTHFADRKVESGNEDSCESVAVPEERPGTYFADKKAESDKKLKHTEQGPSVEEIKVEEATDTRKKHKAPSSSSVSQDSVKKAKSEPIQQTFEPVPDPAIHLTESNTHFADRKVESDNEDSCESVAVLAERLGTYFADKKAERDEGNCVLQGDSAWSNDEMTTSKFLADLKHTLTGSCDKEEGYQVAKSPSVAENNRWNSLHSASQGGDVAIIETMLSLGFDIDSRDSFGTTPLMLAAASGNMQAVHYLLTKGADPSLTTNIGRNLLHVAAEGGNTSIMETMLSHDLDIDSSDNNQDTSLMIAASRNHEEVVDCLLDKGADLSLKNTNGNNVLLIASEFDSIAIIKKLLSRGLETDSRDGKGNTPLMRAAACGKIQTVNYLLEQGADVSLTGENGWSLLHFASEGGNVTIIEIMLSKGLNIDSSASVVGMTPLMIAISNNKVEATNYLLDKGADPATWIECGTSVGFKNALHWASMHGNLTMIDAILSHAHGLDIDVKDTDGHTSLMIAASSVKKLEIVNFLLHKNADPFLTDNYGKNFLHHASYGGNIMIIEKSLSCGLDIESTDSDGITPLMTVAESGNVDAVKYLVKRGAKA